MRTTTSLVLLGMLWAVTVNAAAAKHSEDFFFRQLRSPFERKLKGTRRGCSAYGHSCFGGYGKRGVGASGAGLAGGALPLVAPLPLPVARDLRDRGQADADHDVDRDAEPPAEDKMAAADAEAVRGAPALHAADADDATLIILRQAPVISRAPLWGRPLAGSAKAFRGDGGDLDRADRAEQRADSDEEADPYNAMANRLFLRRWLRTYRRPSSSAH